MRHALLILALASVIASCRDDKPRDDAPNEEPSSRLERPGSLPRPPGRGLPDDLRPPRD